MTKLCPSGKKIQFNLGNFSNPARAASLVLEGARASFDADAADVLADNPLPSEILELIETSPVVEILSLLLDGFGRANLNAFQAFAAAALQRPVHLKGHVGEHRDQPEPRAVFGVDEEVVPAHPSQPGQVAHLLVGEMRLLVFPVEHLGGRDGKGFIAALLDTGRKQESRPVEEEIKLPVVMKIKGSRPVFYLIEHAADEPLSHRYSPVESLFDLFIQEELVSDSGYVRHAEKGDSQVQGEFPEAIGVFLFFYHESPF